MEHGAADAVVKGTATGAELYVGGEVGESVGGGLEAIGGPAGSLAGATAGAGVGVGAVASSPLVSRFKTRRLRRANAALAAYGRVARPPR